VRKHELDVFSLLAGMVFVAVAVVHLVTANTTHTSDVRWVFPVAMVLVGLASLIGLVRRGVREPAPAQAAPSSPPAPAPEEEVETEGL
jgi:steroid 5-alpha reductase family enzyme